MPIPTEGAHLLLDNWRISGAQVQAGGGTPAQNPQIVASPTPFWICQQSYRVERQHFLIWEAWTDSLSQQLREDVVTPEPERMMFGTGLTWTGGVTWTGGAVWGTTVQSLIPAPVDQFARQITVTEVGNFQVGVFFFIAGNMYRTISISGNVVTFEPPLRAALSGNTPVSGTGTISMFFANEAPPVLDRSNTATSDIDIVMRERPST